MSDVDLVAIPKIVEIARVPPPPPTGQVSLFESPPPIAPELEAVNAVWLRLEELRVAGKVLPLAVGCSPEAPVEDPRWAAKRAGADDRRSKYLRVLHVESGLPVDIHLPTVETWGCILAVRTGSSSYAKALVDFFTRTTGGHFREGRLVRGDGQVLPTRDEEDVFRFCGVEYLDPVYRRSANDLIRRRSAA